MNDRQKRNIADAAKALQDDVHTLVDTVYGLRGFDLPPIIQAI